MNVALWIGICALGGAGAVLRVLVTHAVAERPGASLALGTLAVNLVGAFLFGLLSDTDIDHDALLLAGTALLGSFTTFSTWVAEIEALQPRRRALAFAAVTFVLGLACAALGRAVG